MTPGQSSARSPASMSQARSPAAQQGRQTPGSVASPLAAAPPGTVGPPQPPLQSQQSEADSQQTGIE